MEKPFEGSPKLSPLKYMQKSILEESYFFDEDDENMSSSQNPNDYSENDSLIEKDLESNYHGSPSSLRKSKAGSRKYELYKDYDFGVVKIPKSDSQDPRQNQEKLIITKKFENRLRVRYCCAFFIPLVFLGIFLTFYQVSRASDEFSYEINGNTKIFVEMNRCILYLNDEMSDSDKVYGHYYLSHGLHSIFNPDDDQPSATPIFNSEKNELNFSMLSYNPNSRGCSLYLNMPSGINIGNFVVNCHTSCIIVQENNMFKAKTFEIYGESEIHANFRRIEVDDLVFASEKGILQLNSFQISKTAKINLSDGDVILQSEKDILLDWQNEQQTFCFASANVKHQSIQDCALAEDATTSKNSNLTTCKGKTTICSSANCGAMPTIQVTQKFGNLYANRLNNAYEDIEYVDGYKISKGAIYNSGAAFEPNTKAGIDNVRSNAVDDQTDLIFILEMGKKNLQSRRNSLWTIISNPSYAYIRPWWLATFSVAMLTAQTHVISGYLSPGFCPYHIEANLAEIYETQLYLQKYFAINNSVISLVNPDLKNDPDMTYQNGTGFVDYLKERPSNENWISVDKNQEEQLLVVKNDVSKNKFILIALILSFLFAAFVGATILYIFKNAVMVTYKEILERSRHCKHYINYINPPKVPEKKEAKKFNLKGILDENSFQNFIREVPRLSAFIGFYSASLMKKYMIDSVDEFLTFLMNPNLKQQIIKADKGVGDLKFIEMKEKTLKNLYERFCFLNGLTEKQLSDEENLKKFNEYGFKLIDDSENLSLAFTFMQMKDDNSNTPDFTSSDQNSLDLFISTYIDNTKCETDAEFVDEFLERYENFCAKYRLEKCEVRPYKMAHDIKYSFELTNIPRKKLVRMSLPELEDESSLKPGIFESSKLLILRILTCGNYQNKKSLKRKFLIDEEQLKYHFTVILNPNKKETYDILHKKEVEDEKEKIISSREVIDKMIYHSYWYYWFTMDASIIFLHQIITALFVLPFLLMALLMEVSYAPYSIIDPNYLITMSDVTEIPWQILGKIGCFTSWNIFIISLCIFFILYSFLDCLLYFYYSEFPEDQTFENHQKILKESLILKSLSNLQWLLIFLMVFCYSSYIGLLCVWLLLGAIINPNNFLVYSTAALTFLTFVFTKYQIFQEIAENGFKIIQKEVFSMMQKQIKIIVGIMISEEKEKTLQTKGTEISNFSYAKAEELGLDEEIRAMKNFDMKKVDVGKFDTENDPTSFSPESMIEKLKEADINFKEKAIQMFRMKCECLGVTKELEELALNIMFKQTNELKTNLATIIEEQSTRCLEQKLSSEFIQTILNVMVLPNNVKSHNDLATIISKRLLKEFMQHIITKSLIVPVSVKDHPNSEELLLTSFNLIEALKKKDKKNFIKIIKNMTQLLIKNDSPNTEILIKLLDFIDIIMAMKNEAQFKRRIMTYYTRNIRDSDLLELLRAVTFSSPDEQIIEIGNKIYERSENVAFLMESIKSRIQPKKTQKTTKEAPKSPQQIAKKQDSNKQGSNKDIRPKFFENFINFAIRLLKNQTNPEYLHKFSRKAVQLIEVVSQKKLSRDNIKKVVNVAPAFVQYGKYVKSFWNKISQKYNFGIDHIRDIIFLVSNDYYRNFSPDRMAYLEQSKIVQIFARKINMSPFELLGFIAFFYEEYDYKFINDFINGLCDYEERVLPDFFKRKAKLIIKLKFLNHTPFSLYTHLKRLGVLDKNIKEILKNQTKDEILRQINLFNEEPKDQFSIDIEQQNTEQFEVKQTEIYKVIGLGESQKNIEEFLGILSNLFSVKNIDKESSKRNIEIKNKIGEFAERYNYNPQALEYFIFILMADYHNSLLGFKYFLEGEKDYMYHEKTYKQIVKTILKEDRNIQNKSLFENWMPPNLDNIYSDFIAKAFYNCSWSGVDSTDILCELSSKTKPKDKMPLEFEEEKKEIQIEILPKHQTSEIRDEETKKMKNKLFLLLHLQDLEPQIIVNLFPFLENVDQEEIGTFSEEPSYQHNTAEKLFEEKNDPSMKLNMLKAEHKKWKKNPEKKLDSSPIDFEKIQLEALGLDKKKDFKRKFTDIIKLLMNKKIPFAELFELINKHFFNEENETKILNSLRDQPSIRWGEENVKKYVYLFGFLNNPFCKQIGTSSEFLENTEKTGFIDYNLKRYCELRDYYSLFLSPDRSTPLDFDELNRVIRYYFTTDPEVFVEGIIPNLKEFHGKASELIGLLSISTKTPDVDSLANILNCKTHVIDSVLSLCKYYNQNFEDGIATLQKNEKWFKKLSVDMNEFIYIAKFLNNMIDPFDYPKFINLFGLDSFIDNSVLQSIFCIYTRTENFKDELETYMKISKERKVVFEAIELHPTLGDLLCEINSGNFWNIRKVVQSNRMLSDIKIFPEKRAKNLIETISAFIGTISNEKRLDYDVLDLYSKFSLKSITMGNNLESAAYLMYQHFQISPLLFFLCLDMELPEGSNEYHDTNEDPDRVIDYAFDKKPTKSISFIEKQKKNRLIQLKHIFLALQEMSLSDKNKIVEAEFIYQLKTETIAEDLKEKDKEVNAFFSEITGVNVSEEKEQEADVSILPEQTKMYKTPLKPISAKFNSKFEKIYGKNTDKEIKFVSLLSDTDGSQFYLKIRDFYQKTSRLGAPNDLKDSFYPEKNAVTCLVILSLLRDLRKILRRNNEEKQRFEEMEKTIFKGDPKKQMKKSMTGKSMVGSIKPTIDHKKKNEENLKELRRISYSLMIDFALKFDLLLTCMEKIKLIDEEYKYFENFDKNAMNKFLIPIFFPGSFSDPKDDFVLEFFFRNSLFEDEILREISKQIENLKDTHSSLPKKVAKVVLTSKFLPEYFTSDVSENNIETFINYAEKIQTYEQLKSKIEEPKLMVRNEQGILLNAIEITPARMKFLDVLIQYKDKCNNEYQKYKFSAFEALEDYYPPEECEGSANLVTIEAENKRFDSKKAGAFFAQINFKNLEEYPFFNKNCSFVQCENLTDKLNKKFRDVQMLKTDSAKKIFSNLLVILKETSNSKKKNKAFEYVLAKISFNSNFNNLKSFLDVLMEPNIDQIKEYDVCLKKMDIDPEIFYGLFILHFEVAKEEKEIIKCPLFLHKMIGINMAAIKMGSGDLSRNSWIRKLFKSTMYSETQQDVLILLLNSFAAWKKLMFDIFYEKLDNKIKKAAIKEKRLLEEIKPEPKLTPFKEFLELINLFDKKQRKSYKGAILTFLSISDLMSSQKVSFEDFNEGLFKHRVYILTDYDKNNLSLIHAIVQQNYPILIRMFNEVPIFVSRKLNFHHNSHRYFSIKLLIFFSNFGEASLFNLNIVDYLLYQVRDPNIFRPEQKKNDLVMQQILGIDYDFFNLICSTNKGYFSKSLGYLAKTDDKEHFLLLASLYCWIYLPFISHLYRVNTEKNIKARMKVSKILIYGVFHVLKLFYSTNEKDPKPKFLNHKLYLDLQEEIKGSVIEILENVVKKNEDRPIYNIDWFSFPISTFLKALKTDFYVYAFVKKKDKKKGRDPYDINEVKELFGKELSHFVRKFESFFTSIHENKDQKYLSLLLKLFVSYFFGTSGLNPSNNDSIEKLIFNFLNENNVNESDELQHFLSLHSDLTKEKIAGSHFLKEIENNKIYKGMIELSLVGFHIIEKVRNYKPSKAEEYLKKILQNYAENKKNDFFISSMIDWVIFVFNDEPVVREDYIKKFFVNLLAQVYLEIAGKEKMKEIMAKINEEQQSNSKLYQDVFDWERSLEEVETTGEKEKLVIKESEETKGIRLISQKILSEFRNPEMLFTLIEDVSKYIQQYPFNSNEVKNQQLLRIASKLGEMVFSIDHPAQGLFVSVSYLTKGDIDKVGDEMLKILSIDKKSMKKLKQLLHEFRSLVELPQNFIAEKVKIVNASLNQDFNDLDILQEKIKNKELDSKDLFLVFDRDKSGKIGLEEFKLLTRRLNMELSEHRIKEIFTSVKGEASTSNQELNEKEFELAFNYLQEKSIKLTLEFLGITKEILFGILIWLTFLLMILFGFIFAGIAAFTIGGTFGAIINSIFPIAGGVGLSQKGENKENALNMEKIKAEVEKCVEIVQSVKI